MAHPPDLGASADLDLGTPDMLRDPTSNLQQADIDLPLARMRGLVQRRVRVTGLSAVPDQVLRGNGARRRAIHETQSDLFGQGARGGRTGG